MVPVGVVFIQVIACLGYGAIILRLFGILDSLATLEQFAWALGFGTGVIGWLTFFLGISSFLSEISYIALMFPGLVGTFIMRSATNEAWKAIQNWTPRPVERILLLVLCLVALMYLCGALAPPTDADSLAYHFYLVKHFNALGQVEFIPRAVDGAVPMLVQMTYVPTFGLGGELALTLWVMATGGMSAFLLFTLCRRQMSSSYSLLCTLLFITVPAVIYGAGSGQVEIRISIFVMLAALCLCAAIETRDVRYAALCGIAVGFYVGSKFTGLQFALACGLIIVCQRKWLPHAVLLTVATVCVGSQWYIWNAVHTGDPVFPMLYDLLGDLGHYKYWDDAQNQLFLEYYLKIERALDVNFWGMLFYPIAATFMDLEAIESSRTGLGPLPFVLLPLVVLGIWSGCRSPHLKVPLILLSLCTVFYIVWYLSGSPQRVRHLLPILPILMVVLFAFSIEGARSFHLTNVFVASGVLILILQLGGLSLFSWGAVKFVASGQTRHSYIEERINGYQAVIWLSDRLNSADRVYIEQRELAYLLPAASYLGHPLTQNLVSSFRKDTSYVTLRNQLEHVKVNHALLPKTRIESHHGFKNLVQYGCLEIMKELPLKKLGLRTLPDPTKTHGGVYTYIVAKFNPKNC